MRWKVGLAGLVHGTTLAEAKQRRIAPKTRAHKHFCLRGRTHVAILR